MTSDELADKLLRYATYVYTRPVVESDYDWQRIFEEAAASLRTSAPASGGDVRDSLAWALKALEGLVTFTDNGVWIRNTSTELAGFEYEYRKAQETLARLHEPDAAGGTDLEWVERLIEHAHLESHFDLFDGPCPPSTAKRLRELTALRSAQPTESVPWCESCRSYHPVPRDAEHHRALQCLAVYDATEHESGSTEGRT